MVRATVKNLDRRSLRHALSIQTATWRPDSQIGGHMFRVSPFLTHVECVSDAGKTVRLRDDSFEPKDFSEDASFSPNQLNPGDWYQAPGKPSIAAVSNAYFSNALIALDGVAGSACQLQIEDRWRTSYGSRKDDPDRGRMYRARIAYEPVDLAPNQTKEYQVLAYVGPKEREVMEHAGGGGHHVSELIDLGFFSAIAKVLVAFLLGVHRVIPNWGIAIVVLTLTARVLLFPLTVPSIRSMIKMRELKPELDAIGQKYKDDQQARGLAQMELWRKHKVNPLKGCLPQLASMPVWFALYTTLQTAVELYNIPFLWFPDLSEPDPYFILPFIIGSTSFLQQKLMPIQAGDPSQQKMLLYFMPAMFTVFMLFLPAGLGVYMFTNGVLGIIQQQSVEWHARRATPRGGPGQGKVSKLQEPKGQTSTSGRRQGSSNPSESKVSESRPLLGKGKA
jgi:YidC/Oxa1 family membrane protein insertase